MGRYVIDPEVALLLVGDFDSFYGGGHQLLAPTLLRSQLLSLLYQRVRRGELTQKDAQHRLQQVRALNIRLLGDRVLQSTAWKLADQLGWAIP